MVNAAIFKTHGIDGRIGTDITPTLCRDIGRAMADYLSANGPVAVAHDLPPVAAELSTALIEGLSMQGRDVIDIGVATSDMCRFAVGKYSLAGGVVITIDQAEDATGNIELYRDQVIVLSQTNGLDQIQSALMADRFKPIAEVPGAATARDVIEDWVTHCLSFVRGLQPFHIAIDAHSGLADAVLEQILPRLAIKASVINAGRLDELAQVVKENALEFGVAFDRHAGGIQLIDDTGRVVLGTDLLSILAHNRLQEYPGSSVVHGVRASRATTELIKDWGGDAVRVRSVAASISAKMRELNAPLGGDTTGNFFFKENFYGQSGIIAMLVAIQAITDAHKRLSHIVDDYRRYAMNTDVAIASNGPQSAILELQGAFADGQQDMLDGLAVNYPDMWFNVRPSTTEPRLYLTAEARTKGQLDVLLDRIKRVIQG